MNMPTPLHIPRGHELVKRYTFRDLGVGEGAYFDEDEDGGLVKIDDLKAHLLKWLQGEYDKLSPDNRDEFSRGCRFAIKAVQHHINHILFP